MIADMSGYSSSVEYVSSNLDIESLSIDFNRVIKPQLGPDVTWIPVNKPMALITGITGQDGSYLAEWLLHKGYNVHGIVRRASTNNLERISHILNRITIHEGDITDTNFVRGVLESEYFVEIYNLAAQSHVHTSFGNAAYTFNVNTLGLLNILDVVRDRSCKTKIYQASTSEMFGNSPSPQGMETPFNPQSPYAIAKLSAHELIRHYRETYGIFAVSGILFNHESPRRGLNFVTRKITHYFGDPDFNMDEIGKLRLGNIYSMRDWGFAPDYVKVMWASLQEDKPKDFVLGTGVTNSVEQFLDMVGAYTGLDWKKYVDCDSLELIRPAEVNELQAKTDVVVPVYGMALVKIMLDFDTKFPDPIYNDYVSGHGYEYYMDYYGDVFAWR